MYTKLHSTFFFFSLSLYVITACHRLLFSTSIQLLSLGMGGLLELAVRCFFYHRTCDHVSKARWILLWMWMRLLFIMGVGENLYGDGSCGQISRS